jgi:hypothetical protein
VTAKIEVWLMEKGYLPACPGVLEDGTRGYCFLKNGKTTFLSKKKNR